VEGGKVKRTPLKRKTALKLKTGLKSLSDAPIKLLKSKLDALCSQYVRLRDNYTCVICGTRNPTWIRGDWTSAECGHLLSRTVSALRFDLRPDGNLHVNCHKCNTTHGGQHFRIRRAVDQWPYVAWYIKKYGMERWEQLRREGEASKHWRPAELEMLIEETKIALKQLRDGAAMEGELK
jgi:hypothetical protein